MFLVRLLVSTSVASALTVTAAPPAAAQMDTASSVYMVNKTGSSVGFTIYGSMIFKIKRDGRFKDFTGELAYDPANPGTYTLQVAKTKPTQTDLQQDTVTAGGPLTDVGALPPAVRLTAQRV